MQQGTSVTLTDEQILGLDPENGAGGTVAARDAQPGESLADFLDDRTAASGEGKPLATAQRVSGGAKPQTAVDASNAPVAERSQHGPSEDPAWLKTLEAQPEAAAEARRWRAAANDVAELDAAYFSPDAGARSGLAARLYDSDPAAFRDMLSASARMLAERDPQALDEIARRLGSPEPGTQSLAAKSLAQAARTGELSDPAKQGNSAQLHAANSTTDIATAFPAESYRAFESAANGEIEQRVHENIDRLLSSTLPEGIAEGARRRIGQDIFQELHASLSGDRELSRQVGEMLRDWRFDHGARQQVVALLAGRARAVLPEVTRRVVAEWTSSVLASDRAKNARIDVAMARQDITGGRLPEPVPASALLRRDIDYRRTSDEQILDM
jgi:hypothetical protein